MGTAIGEILPLAVALACGPLPILAIVLILVSGDARGKGIGFVFGRMAGLALIVAATMLIFSFIGDPALGHRDHPLPAMSIARIVIGGLLLAWAVRMWIHRNEAAKPSPIARRVDGLTTGSAIGMGLLVSVLDPASISIGLLVGVDIAAARLSALGAVLVAAGFVLLSTVPIIVPLIGYLAGGEAGRRRLAATREWLVSNEKAVMIVLALLIGALLIGRGIRDLSGM